MSKPELGAGDVPLELADGETIVLKPTLQACMTLTTRPEGLFGDNSVYDRIARFDLGVMSFVVRLAVGLGPQEVKDLEERLWRTGLPAVRDALQVYLGVIVNGGVRPTSGEGGGDTEAPPAKTAPAGA